MSELARVLEVATEVAREAGNMLRQEFHRPGGARGSGGHAEVDGEAEMVIRQKLLADFPKWSYRGEESGQVVGSEPYLWLVDPNDGTSAYLKGWRGSSVSIAALHKGVPVLGVVYAFGYPDDSGDLVAWAEGCPLMRNGQPVQVNHGDGEFDARSIVFVSQDADRNPGANLECVRPARYITLPSIAYRLARVAVGDGVAAVSLNGPGAWDYAGGHALLRAANGLLLNQDGEEVRYSADGHSSTRWCFGGSLEVVRSLCHRDWNVVFRSATSPEPPFSLVWPARGRAASDPGMLARAQGCLLGQLAGDSLGGLVEFRSPDAISSEYPDGCHELKDGGTWKLLAGQPTDDSELALMLARSLVHRGTYDRAAVLDAYCHWYASKPFDCGGTIGRALHAASGVTPAKRLEAAELQANQTSQANGSLMRISPLGIFGAGRPEQAIAWARDDSRLTHPNPVCQDACAVFVAALATTITKGGGPEPACAAALAEARKPTGRPEVLRALEDARDRRPANYLSQMGWVLIALQNAFYQLLHAPSLEAGVVDTVMRGGDTDTNAAIAGALLGAVHGRQAIPARWTRALLSCRPLAGTPTAHPRPVGFWPVDVLQLAELLLVIGRPPS